MAKTRRYADSVMRKWKPAAAARRRADTAVENGPADVAACGTCRRSGIVSHAAEHDLTCRYCGGDVGFECCENRAEARERLRAVRAQNPIDWKQAAALTRAADRRAAEPAKPAAAAEAGQPA